MAVDIQDHGVIFTIKDNGKGFDIDHVTAQATPDRGLGLSAMAQRARMAGGSFEILAHEGAGTKIIFYVPYA